MQGCPRLFLLRRKYQTLAVLCLIILLFLWFQFFSHQRLNGWNTKHSKNKMLENGQKNKQFVRVDYTDLSESRKQPRGVHPSDVDKYKIENGVFHCLKSKQIIKSKYFNDDYCDCDDFTDEPGTSACPDSRFYCTFQLDDEKPQFVPSSRVNDGICDCCDGSDEWARSEVPPNIKLPKERQGHPVFHAPCENQCTVYVRQKDKAKKIHRQGHKLKHSYIQAAKTLEEKKRKEYGSEGEFYKLSQLCFDYATKEYEYKVCPFKSVTQQKFPQASVSLGRVPKWQQMKPGDFILVMGGGDSKVCPDMIPRQTKIRFLCGLEDRIINVEEYSRCFYLVKFSTPAAC